jgi:hypothetical protein
MLAIGDVAGLTVCGDLEADAMMVTLVECTLPEDLDKVSTRSD